MLLYGYIWYNGKRNLNMEKGEAMIKIWGSDVPGFQASYGQPVPTLVPYIVEGKEQTGAIIVCPGGAYQGKAPHEGGPVAKWLQSIGISAFVLEYRVTPYHHPVPLQDARRAIQYVRAHAADYNIDPKRVGILGFSAGGHLAASSGIFPVDGDPTATDPVARQSSQPNCMVLCYPVISLERFYHKGSVTNLLGENPPEQLRHELSLDNQVTADLPPTFIWHTADDSGVPVENSLFFAQALSKNKVNFEMHIFRHGRHGLGLAQEQPEVAAWTDLCATWLGKIGFR